MKLVCVYNSSDSSVDTLQSRRLPEGSVLVLVLVLARLSEVLNGTSYRTHKDLLHEDFLLNEV